jgi:hypothetical protein
MAEFLAMLGLTYNENITLSGEMDFVKIETDAEKLINDYLHIRPDIVRSKQEIERFKASHLQTAMQSRAPQLNLSFNWNGSSFDPFVDRVSGTATLSIPVDPWIPGTARHQTIRRTSSALEKAKLDLSMTEDAAKRQIRSLSALLRNSWDSMLSEVYNWQNRGLQEVRLKL